MPSTATFNYFYGDEATEFSYFRIPSQLITHPRFKHLSTDSKLLYGMPQTAIPSRLDRWFTKIWRKSDCGSSNMIA